MPVKVKVKSRDDIISTVRKLLSLADASRNDNENQAELALDKAHELMEQHGLEMAQMHEEQNTSWEIDRWSDKERSQYDTYVKVLGNATSILFNCKSYMIRSSAANKYRVKMVFIGEKTDLAMVQEVWPWLVKTVKSLAKRHCGQAWTPSHRSFAEAFADKVWGRAYDMSKQDVAKTEASVGTQCTALVVVEKKNAIQEFMKGIGLTLRKSRGGGRRGGHDPYAADAGREEGSKVRLNFKKQVSGGSNTGLIR